MTATLSHAVRERQILFGGEMVRATLEDRKQKTRRTRGLEYFNDAPDAFQCHRWWEDHPDGRHRAVFDGPNDVTHLVACPYGQPGDRLWVRETFFDYDAGEPQPRGLTALDTRVLIDERIEYRATPWTHEFADPEDCGPWTPSIHMPRWASRLTLELTEVRVERVQDVSEADAIAEGIAKSDDEGLRSWPYLGAAHPVKGTPKVFATARQAFASVWDSLNAKRDGGAYAWQRNPWVWVLSFQKVAA